MGTHRLGSIAYREAGAGPPLVLLHGGLVDGRSWRWQLDGLAEGFRVVAWDAPGFGGSSRVAEHWRMPEFADALAAWLSDMGIERPHILGLSWGSSIALELYRRHPDVPASLILASAYAGWAGSLPPEEVAGRLSAVLAASERPPAEMAAGWPGLFGPSAPPELVREMAGIWLENAERGTPESYRTMAYSMAEADLRPMLSSIQVPTLLIYGALDARSPLSVARDLHGRIPSSDLVVLPDVGHFASAEAPDVFNDHVRTFLESL